MLLNYDMGALTPVEVDRASEFGVVRIGEADQRIRLMFDDLEAASAFGQRIVDECARLRCDQDRAETIAKLKECLAPTCGLSGCEDHTLAPQQPVEVPAPSGIGEESEAEAPAGLVADVHLGEVHS